MKLSAVRLSTLLLALAATPLLSGCLGLVLLPRIDLSSSERDPHGKYESQFLPDGSSFVVGVDSSNQKSAPWVAHIAADKKTLWQHTYGVLGQGGHAQLVSGAVLGDGSFVAGGAMATVTSLALAGFETTGQVRWAWELDLPSPAMDRIKVMRAGNGVVALLPVRGSGGAESLVLVRADAKGTLVWAQQVDGLGFVFASAWDDVHGLGLLTRSVPSKKGTVLTRLSTSGELLWSRSLSEQQQWSPASLAFAPEGGILAAGPSAFCESCRNDVVVVRFDGKGHLDWHTTLHRPPPAEAVRAYEETHPSGWPSSPTVQVVGPRPAGGAYLVATIPNTRAHAFDLAFLELGPDGAILSQRAAAEAKELPVSFTVTNGTFLVVDTYGTPCVSPPPPAGAPSPSPAPCGTSEHPLSLRWQSPPLTPGELQLTLSPLTATPRDLRDEMQRTEKRPEN